MSTVRAGSMSLITSMAFRYPKIGPLDEAHFERFPASRGFSAIAPAAHLRHFAPKPKFAEIPDDIPRQLEAEIQPRHAQDLGGGVDGRHILRAASPDR